MILSRRRIIRNKDDKLPYDAEIEYLQSSGTQYIDTGVISQANLVYDFYLEETQNNNQKAFFGFKEGNTWTVAGMNDCNWGASWFYIDFASAETRLNNFNYPNRNGVYHFEFVDGDAKFLFNNTSKWTSTKTGTYTGNRHVFIFWMDYYTESANRKGIGKIRYFKISKNGVLLFDGIPVRKGSVGYLYDRVSKKLFGNAGTGDFILGQDIVEVEYLESTGTQYINANVIYDSSKEITIQSGVTIHNNGTVTLNGWDAGGAFGQLNGMPTNGDGNTFGVSIYNTYCDMELLIRAATDTQTTLKVIVNGTPYSRNRAHGSLGTYANGQGYKLFACQSQSSVKYFISEKMYYCKIWKDGSLVRDFVPVRVGTVGYLFDKVYRTLFSNAGSGNFIIGADKNS